jgi:putative transposase
VRIRDPHTGRTFIRKRLRRRNEPGQARHLNFSCFRRYRFLGRDRTRQWFLDALQAARQEWEVDLWAYVLMPEHVHLLVYPRGPDASVSGFLDGVKEEVGRKAVTYLKCHAPEWLPRITVREGNRVRHRSWQPGGGHDRNVADVSTLRQVIDYIHANPVRRGLAQRPEDWEWSSARCYAGMTPVPITMDRTLPDEPVAIA